MKIINQMLWKSFGYVSQLKSNVQEFSALPRTKTDFHSTIWEEKLFGLLLVMHVHSDFETDEISKKICWILVSHTSDILVSRLPGPPPPKKGQPKMCAYVWEGDKKKTIIFFLLGYFFSIWDGMALLILS